MATTQAYREAHREEIAAYRRDYRERNRELLRAQDRAHYAANRDAIRAQQAAYRREHREELRERDARYQSEHPEVHREASRRYNASEKGRATRRARYEADPQAVKERSDAWRAANPEAVKAIRRRSQADRRARLSGVFVESVDASVVFERDRGICQICQEKVDPVDFHIDHRIPLNPGLHSYANVQLAHPRCNLRKGRRVPIS